MTYAQKILKMAHDSSIEDALFEAAEICASPNMSGQGMLFTFSDGSRIRYSAKTGVFGKPR